ncbi:SDR family NAD(P)-dependent oxidoreductase [Teredinibacter purpureus]|uniref:SDR family NAD(P)-dependent oxidoreductase n=1 Tax=Teredinibacter purpureus TaxID=2731756 RepID=UPI0005F8720E|nr:SDR family oxidoreductase [Teredinibacter purpureus]
MTLTNQYPSLKDRVVLITGGASGIGANMVEAFCRQQAIVAFIDILADEAEALVAQLTATEGVRAPRYFQCDLRDISLLQATINAIAELLGPIAVLLNNAGDDERHDFREVTVDYWDDRIAVNLRHYFFAAQAVYPYMQSLGYGSIINLGSMSWYARQGEMPSYTSAKAAVEGLTRGLARDMGLESIRVNTLVPGWVATPRQLEKRLSEDAQRHICEAQCLKRMVQPEDVAAMALFLAADDSQMCTSQHFIVDGGWV